MDTPEQPIVWPPAPASALPAAKKTKPFKLKRPVPEWLGSTLKEGAELTALLYVVQITTSLWERHHLPHWTIYADTPIITFLVIGIVKWQKLRPRS